MAGVSSLLRSAQAAQAKARQYQDELVAYQWDNSTKTYADFVAYEKYLNAQADSVADPSTQLSYARKADSARNAFISNEIERQSINVIEGAQSNTDKYNRMVDLYYYAAEAGQYDAAQRLRLQLDNLSVTIQNEQRAAIAANKELSAQITKQLDAQVKDAEAAVKNYASETLKEFQTLGPTKFEAEYGSDVFSILANLINSEDPNNPGLVQVYDQVAQQMPDPDKIRDYQTKLNDIANGGKTGIELPGLGAISYKDLQDQLYAQSIGQTLFDSKVTGEGTVYTKRQTTGYAWGRDETGNYKLMPILKTGQDFTSGVTDPSDPNKTLSYGALLEGAAKTDGKNVGYEIIKNEGNQLVVRNNGAFDSAGVARGQQVQLYVDEQGNLQTVVGDRAYTLGFSQEGGITKFTGIQASTPSAINMLPSGKNTYSQFNDRYFATQDLSNLPAGAVGLIDTTSPIARSMEAGPLAKPQPVLQQAATPVPRPVAPTTVQGGAVSPVGLPANTRIDLAKPQPLPKITIAKPKPLPNLTVTQARPQTGLRVSAPAPTPRIVF